MSTIEETLVIEPESGSSSWLDYLPEITTASFLTGVIVAYVFSVLGGTF